MTDCKKWIWMLPLSILLAGGLGACTTERQPCLIPKTASLNIECVHFASDTATTTIDTALPYATFSALTGAGTRSVLYYTPSSVFTISLSTITDSCQWLLQTDSAVTGVPLQTPDTLSFYYKRQLQFLSNACGYGYFFYIDSVATTRNNIDSVKITNPSVTNNANAAKQVTIYIKPTF